MRYGAGMAQTVEIPFSLVRDHPAVRNLNAQAFGAYCSLVMAALFDGVDLNAQNDRSLVWLSRSHGLTWNRIQSDVMRAVNETFPIVFETYQKKKHVARKRSELSSRLVKYALEAWKAKAASARQLKTSELGTQTPEAKLLVDEGLGSQVSQVQPQLAPRNIPVRENWSDQSKLRQLRNKKSVPVAALFENKNPQNISQLEKRN